MRRYEYDCVNLIKAKYADGTVELFSAIADPTNREVNEPKWTREGGFVQYAIDICHSLDIEADEVTVYMPQCDDDGKCDMMTIELVNVGDTYEQIGHIHYNNF